MTPMHLKIAHWLPVLHPINKAIGTWAASLERASQGSLTTSIHPAEELGKGPDHYDMVRDGVADIGMAAPGYQMRRFPLVSVADQPFMFGDARKGSRAFDNWYRGYSDREMPDVHYCFTFVMGPGVIHSTRRIARPEDLAGLRLRPASATVSGLFTRMGADVRRCTLVETPQAVKDGLLDGVAVPWGGLFLFGYDSYFKYHIDLPLYTAAFTMVLNEARYRSMTDVQRQAIQSHATTEWAERFGADWMEFESWGRSQIGARADHETVRPTRDEMAGWRQAAAPLKADWMSNVRQTGHDPEAVWSEVTGEIAKAGAMPQ